MVVGRRGQAAERRDERLTLRLNKDERAAVEAAASAEGLAVGAWAGPVLVAAATRTRVRLARRTEGSAVVAELVRVRVQLRKLGGLLNQVAVAVNTTGKVPAMAVRLLVRIREVVEETDRATRAVRR